MGPIGAFSTRFRASFLSHNGSCTQRRSRYQHFIYLFKLINWCIFFLVQVNCGLVSTAPWLPLCRKLVDNLVGSLPSLRSIVHVKFRSSRALNSPAPHVISDNAALTKFRFLFIYLFTTFSIVLFFHTLQQYFILFTLVFSYTLLRLLNFFKNLY